MNITEELEYIQQTLDAITDPTTRRQLDTRLLDRATNENRIAKLREHLAKLFVSLPALARNLDAARSGDNYDKDEALARAASQLDAIAVQLGVKGLAPDLQTLNEKVRTLILMGSKQAGSFDPDLALPPVEEQLTIAEARDATRFLRWVTKNGKRFGHGTIEAVYREYQIDQNHVHAAILRERGEIQ